MLPKLNMPHWKDDKMRGMIRKFHRKTRSGSSEDKHKKRTEPHDPSNAPLPNEEPNRRRNLDGNTYIPLLNLSKTRVLGHLCLCECTHC